MWSRASAEFEELLYSQPGLADDRGQGLGSQIPRVVRDRDLPPGPIGMPHVDMAPPLTHHDEPRPLQDTHHLAGLKKGDVRLWNRITWSAESMGRQGSAEGGAR